MVTAGFLVLLLITSAGAAARPSSDGDDVCRARPMAVSRLFFSCVHGQQPAFTSFDNQSKDHFIEFIENTCTTVLPAARTCFADHLSRCDEDVQVRLTRLAASGGFLCQVNSTDVEPAILNVFDHISDDDFVRASAGCPNMMFDVFCLSQLISALTRDRSQRTLESSISSIQSLQASYFRCEARRFQAASRTCPFWRATLLRTVGLFSLAPEFGVSLPFSTTQLSHLFRI